MCTEDLHWAWKLRDQKRQQERKHCNSASTQESKELLELYAADIEDDMGKDDDATIVKCNKKEPAEDVT